MVILKARQLSFAFLVFITNLNGVDHRFNKGVCDWSCVVENANATSEAIKNAIAEGRLLKLTIMYKEWVGSARCANETKLDTIIFNTTVIVLLKPSIDLQTKGKMAFITQSILEVIFSGQFFPGSYIEMKVSCMFEPTSKKNSTNVNYERLTPLHSPQSILHYVENLANNTKTNSTLVRMTVGHQSRIFVVTAGNQSSHTFTKDNDLLTFNDGWFATVVIIWIIFALYSPVTFRLFRPSKLKVKLPKYHKSSLTTPTQEAEDSGGYMEQRRHERQNFPSEHPERGNIPARGETNDHGSHDGATADEECARWTPVNSSSEEKNDTLNLVTELSSQAKSQSTDEKNSSHRESDRATSLVSSCKVERREQDSPSSQSGQSSPMDEISKTDYTHANFVEDTNPVGAGSFIEHTKSENTTTRGNTDDHGSHDGSTADEEYARQKPVNSSGEEENTALTPVTELSSQAELSPRIIQILQGTDEKNSSHGEDDQAMSLVPSCKVKIGEQDLPSQQPGQRSPLDETSKTNYTHAIIVGDTNPVGVGSFIGNIFFSSLNIDTGLKALRLIIIFILPFCFIGLGDLLLIMLQSFPKRTSVSLPSPFLSVSVFHSTVKHPGLLTLVVLSALCYLMRLVFGCYLLSKNSMQTPVSCSLYSKHLICFVYEELSSKLTDYKSPFNPFTPLRNKHWKHIVYNAFYQRLSGVLNFFSPFYEIYKGNAKECFEYYDVAQNVSFILLKQVSIALDHCNAYVELCTSYKKIHIFIWCILMVASTLLIIPVMLLDIIVSSPLAYLCHEHKWILRELFKNKFKGSYYICSCSDIVMLVFSLIWLIFSWGIYSAVPLGVLIVGTIKTIASYSIVLLSEVSIVMFSVYYLWSCYGAFTKFYYDLVYKLGSSYQKKYCKRKKQQKAAFLINYKQGKEGYSVKVIPEKLFKNACEDHNLHIRNQLVCLLLKLFFTLLLLSSVWPIISEEAIMAKTSLVAELAFIITFFVGAYTLINNCINGEKLKVSTEDADKLVDDYIEEMERLSVPDMYFS